MRVRRQRTLPGLVQPLPDIIQRFRTISGGTDPGWPDRKEKQPATKRIGDQVTDSEEHPQWRKRLKDNSSLEDVGGDFFSQKHYVYGIPTHTSVVTEPRYITAGMYGTTEVVGPFWSIDAKQHPFPPSNHSTDFQLDTLGATAVARCKPTNSQANLAVALGELVREGIPKLAVQTWKGRANRIRQGQISKEIDAETGAAATNYLGYQFGLAPLGREIGSFAGNVTRADQLLAQYERDAGKVVRRRYEFPTRTETSVSESLISYPVYMGKPQTGTLDPLLTDQQHRTVRIHRELEQKRWFSGAFTYYLPSGYDARNEMERKALLAKEILGVDLFDIETIWNLSPWSWAVDWFSNAGDVISNIQSYAEDGLIMRYGYMMEHTVVKDTYTRAYPNTLRGGRRLDSYVTLVTETKIRRRANPFGFGLTMGGLSAFQWSILAALGISRRP